VAKVTNQVFDTTVDFKPGSGGALTDGLAKEWSLDGKTATITLKEGVNFHNGEELTSADVRATIRRFIDEDYKYFLGENRSGYSSVTFGDWIASMEESGKYELTINLSQRYAPFVRNLAMFAAAILSKAQIESVGEGADAQAELGTDPKGTGPFVFEELDNDNERIRFTAHGDFWGKGPKVDELIIKTIKSNQTRAQDLINGDSHLTDNLSAQAIQQIDNSDSASSKLKDGINVGYMAFNQSRKEAFRKPKVRRAISYAVDTKAIVDSIYQGFASQADQPLPPNVLGHNDDLDPYPTTPTRRPSSSKRPARRISRSNSRRSRTRVATTRAPSRPRTRSSRTSRRSVSPSRSTSSPRSARTSTTRTAASTTRRCSAGTPTTPTRTTSSTCSCTPACPSTTCRAARTT